MIKTYKFNFKIEFTSVIIHYYNYLIAAMTTVTLTTQQVEYHHSRNDESINKILGLEPKPDLKNLVITKDTKFTHRKVHNHIINNFEKYYEAMFTQDLGVDLRSYVSYGTVSYLELLDGPLYNYPIHSGPTNNVRARIALDLKVHNNILKTFDDIKEYCRCCSSVPHFSSFEHLPLDRQDELVEYLVNIHREKLEKLKVIPWYKQDNHQALGFICLHAAEVPKEYKETVLKSLIGAIKAIPNPTPNEITQFTSALTTLQSE